VTTMPFTILGIALLGAAAWIGTVAAPPLVADVARADDAPRPGRPPTPWLIGGSAALGGLLAPHSTLPQLTMATVLVFALVTAWSTDVLHGVVPDICTLGPLAVILSLALLHHTWTPLISALILFAPFAAAASLSKGLGMGWGDVKLATLGGAALGAPLALLLFAGASLVAVIVGRALRRGRAPIAFAPYLAAAIGMGLAVVGIL